LGGVVVLELLCAKAIPPTASIATNVIVVFCIASLIPTTNFSEVGFAALSCRLDLRILHHQLFQAHSEDALKVAGLCEHSANGLLQDGK
jgi:hypothetical protein